MRLLKLLKSAMVKAAGLALLVVRVQILIETVADTLTKSVDTCMAARLRLLIANFLVVVVGVVGLGVGGQLDHPVSLCRHLPRRARRSTLANIGSARRRDGISIGNASAGVRARVEPDLVGRCSASQHRILSLLTATWSFIAILQIRQRYRSR